MNGFRLPRKVHWKRGASKYVSCTTSNEKVADNKYTHAQHMKFRQGKTQASRIYEYSEFVRCGGRQKTILEWVGPGYKHLSHEHE